MGEHVTTAANQMLVALGLGSCIGCAILDPLAGVGGLAHIVLPDSGIARDPRPPGKYADTAVPRLADEICRLGGEHARLTAVLCGGAHMFGEPGLAGGTLDIGSRNAAETVRWLGELGIPIRASAVGGARGRSMEVRVRTGEVLARTVGEGEIVL